MPATPDPALQEQLRLALDAHYAIEGELGGGMSRVFSATERALGRRVVIKVLPPELTAGVNRDRFRREIQFAARLQHPHIVPLLTAGQVGDILYYTMPLVEGETLRARLEQRGRLDAATVVGILQDVVDAIAYAHGQGLIHRDIKPENILLQRHHALVTDFGVAKAISEALPGGTGVTTVGVAVGTPAYMAPEQLAADPAADHRVDLYAVGLLAYELLSGSSPFAGSSPQQTLARQLTERPTPPHINRTDVPAALSSLIMRCLEKEPEDRWESADQLLQALQAIRITASGIPAVTRTRRIEAGRPRRRVWAAVGAVAAIVTLAVAGYVIYTGPAPAPATDSTPAVVTPPAPIPVAAPALTRADSEAIALSVARRMNQQRSAPSGALSQAAVDSIKAEVERSVYDSVRRMLAGRPSFTFNTPGLGTPRLPGTPNPPVNLEGRRGLRVAVQDVLDGSRDKSLGGLASALTDSLRKIAGRRPATDLLSPDKVRSASSPRGNPEAIALELGADVLLRGIVEIRGDSARFTVVLHDVNAGQFSKSLRAAAPIADAASIMDPVSGPLTGWLDQRRPGGRTAQIYNIGPGGAVDSALRYARQLRDSVAKARGRKPDSIPPRPEPRTQPTA